MSDIIAAKEFAKALCPALGIEYNRTRRIVLDIDVNSFIVAYVELVGDDRLLNISQTLEGVDLRVVKVQDMQP